MHVMRKYSTKASRDLHIFLIAKHFFFNNEVDGLIRQHFFMLFSIPLAALLDLERAFDSVWHNGLLYKLHEKTPPPPRAQSLVIILWKYIAV